MPATAEFKQAVSGEQMAEDGEIPTGQWALVEQYRQDLLAQALAIVQNAEDAEDVVQETFAEAFRRSEKLSEARSLGAWLRSVNRANALDFLRNKHAQAERKERAQPQRTYTTGGISAVEVNDSVAQAIDSLPPHYRTVLVLHYWQHFTCEQIAEKLAMPAGTVKWLLAEASLRLHHKLKPIIETGCHQAIESLPVAKKNDDEEKTDAR